MAEQATMAAAAVASSESISARSVRLNQLFLEKSSASVLGSQHLMSRETLLDSLNVLYEECQQEQLKKDRNVTIFVEKFRTTMSTLKKLRVSVGDFEMKKVIGRGHFGDVHVVREKHTGCVYAMKVLRKSDTLAQQSVAFYDEERDIMAKAKNVWITRLQYAFQDATNLYLVMEFLPGGDLLSLLDRHDGVLSEDVARFFLAEIVLAIHALHCMGYVHRDIKPDNVLIDRTGHVKLADFGSSAKLTRYDTVSSKMPVGTPDYIAPEVLASMEGKKGSYGRSCDFWSLGVVAYEMLYGNTPFSETKVVSTYSNIMNYKKTLKFIDDAEVSEKAKQLIEGLLTESVRRLDFEGLCRHQFFETVNWEGIRESLPPFVPNVVGQDDTSNFEEFEAVAPKADIPDLPKQQGSFSGKNLPFVGFTYTQLFDPSVECGVSSSPSRKSLNNLESQLQAKKREVGELRLKVDSLEKLEVGGRAESEKLTEQLREQEKIKLLAERECERLCREISIHKSQCSVRQTNITSYKRLVELERTERVKTEKKAMELLKDIKAKWKNAEKQKLDALSKENDSLKQFIRELERKYRDTRIDALTLQEEMSSVVKMAENATVKAKHYKEKLRRSSACEALTLDTLRQQLALAERQLVELKEERGSFDVQLNAFKEKANKLENDCHKLEKTQQYSETTSMERLRALGQELDELKGEILAANDLLADKDVELTSCKERIEELEARLRSEFSSQQTVKFQKSNRHQEEEEKSTTPSNRQSFRRAKLSAKLEEVEAELDRVKSENNRLQDELLTAKDSDSEKTQTVEELRLIVDRLECGLKRLDADNKCDDDQTVVQAACGESDRERIFFEAQISKLEAQLENTKEALLREKQSVREVRTEWFKMDRELRDTKIDLRIAARESKTASEQLSTLQDQATVSNEACQQSEAALGALQTEARSLRTELDLTKRDLQCKEKCWENEKARLSEKVNTLQSSCQELHDLHTKLGASDGRSRELEKQLKNAEDLLKRADEDKRRAQQREDQARTESKNMRTERDVLQMNLDCLKQACQSMEDQLGDYERLVDVHESEENRLKGEISVAQKSMEKLRGEVKRAGEAAVADRVKAESAMREADEFARRAEVADVVHDSEVQSIVAQRNEYRSMVSELSQQVAELEGELNSYEAELGNSKHRQVTLNAEAVRIKEEAAKLITQIHALRDTNFKVSRQLEEAQEGRTSAEARCLELENEIREERIANQVQRVKLDETISQQTKLIHFLQMKAEAAQKRKKTFTEKLFGSRNGNDSKEPFLPPTPTSVTVRKTQREQPHTIASRHQEVLINGKDNGNLLSPNSKEVLTTLAKSPGIQESPDRPLTQKGIPKPSSERMHHNIPHQFQTGLCMHATKCAACLDSIHFGRNVARCLECRISAHPKCADSLPNACNLPMGLMQHFRHSMRYGKGTSKRSANDIQSGNCAATSKQEHLSGWLKVPKTENHGWQRTFARLDGTILRLYDEIRDNEFSSSPTNTVELCDAEGTAKVVEAVMPLEMTATAKSDLPYIFKVVTQPSTTCWPTRCIYFMADNFQDKLDWVAALERVIKSNSSAAVVEQELLGSVLLSIDDASNVDLNCTAFLNSDIMLIGAEDGLYVVDLMEDKNTQPKLRIPSFGAIYQMAVVSSVAHVLLLIAGNERRLYWLRLSDVCALVNGETEFTASHLSMLHSVSNVSCCHLFVVTSIPAEKPRSTSSDVYLCAATADRVVILVWNSSMKSFCVRKELMSAKPCSCVLFTDNSVIIGTDKFYEVDLANLAVEDFVDDSDPSLYHVVHGAHLLRSFPMAIFCVSPMGTQPEYLLCFYELGIFVDAYGRRSRRNDLRWTYLPLCFAFRWPYLYIVHFNSIEVYEIIVHKEKCFSVHTFVDLSSPRYLGSSTESGTIVIAVVKGGQADVFCFNGEAAVKRKVLKAIKDPQDWNENKEKAIVVSTANDEDCDSNCETEFSFSSSVMHALVQEDDDENSGGVSAPESEV